MPRARAKRGAAAANGDAHPNGTAVEVTAAEEKQVADPMASLDANALKEKGNTAFLSEKYDVALDFFSKAIAKDAGNASLYSNRAAAYVALRRFPMALADAEQAILLRPEWAKGYLRRGHAAEGMLCYAEALEAYTNGLQLEPEDRALKVALAELQRQLEELRVAELQARGASGPNPESDRFERMARWLRDGGARFPQLHLKYYGEEHRGVHALTRIPADRELLFVPRSHLMTSELARNSDIGRKITQSGVELRSEHSQLAAFLCQEKYNPDSFWRPYIDVLPAKYRNVPIFFTPEEVALLKGSFVAEKIGARLASLVSEYEAICAAVPEFRRFTELDFIWARLVVITRIFGFEIKGQKHDALVAYADMLNHKRPRETKWTFDDDQDGFIITALQDIPSGGEVYDSYGKKCNSRFFLNYGFALEENEDNENVLKVALPKNDPLSALKVAMMGGEQFASREFQVPASYAEKKTRELFAFLRLVHAREAEMKQIKALTCPLEEIPPLSVANELAALKHVAHAAQTCLAGYETSLEEDTKLLAEPRYSLSPNQRTCIVVRAGEKRVLHWFLELARHASQLLQAPLKEVRRVAAKGSAAKSAFEYYVVSAVLPLRRAS